MRLALALALLSSIPLAHGAAQDAGRAEITVADGTTWRGRFPAAALTVTSSEVSEASCRSCVGRHTQVGLSASFASGPIAEVRIFADLVARSSGTFSTGRGPYPATVMVDVRLRGETELRPLRGSLAIEARELVFTAREPSSPIASMRFTIP